MGLLYAENINGWINPQYSILQIYSWASTDFHSKAYPKDDKTFLTKA